MRPAGVQHVCKEDNQQGKLRDQKRPITGVLEWAIERAAAPVDLHHNPLGQETLSFLGVIDELWSSDEAVRFVRLAIAKPSLLDYNEMRLWETIQASDGFWRVHDHSHINEQQLFMHLIQRYWDGLLVYVARHRHRKSITPYAMSNDKR